MGDVFWITGLSGAGKTTIGKLFYEKLKEKYVNTVFLDGDTLREVFGNDLGYSDADRRKCAMRYAKLCDFLQRQGMNVICCTISMFDEIRQWNRGHIENYHEIYVKVSDETLHQRDQKGLYSRYQKGEEQELAGYQVGIELPQNSDLILFNDGVLTPEEQVRKIIDYMNLKKG